MMDSDENDFDNLFEEHETEEKNTDEAIGNNEQETNPSNETQNAERVPVPKRIVRNPRLKFNADRLCGERGIPVLINHFKDVKFKGKGYEVEDLNKLLSTLEHWCHRLYPSMKLEDCLRQIEKLGKKRPVQTCLRKIRLDMPILANDFVQDDPEEAMETELDLETPSQTFDRLINENQEGLHAQITSTPKLSKTHQLFETSPVIQQTSGTSTLSEEQRKRIASNRLLAFERRRKAELSAKQSSHLIDPDKDLFTNEQSLLRNLSNNQGNDFTPEDSLQNTSLLYEQSNKLHQDFSTNANDEELDMDEVMDLLNEDNKRDLSKNHDKQSSTQDRQAKIIDLCNEDGNKSSTSSLTEYVDLENTSSVEKPVTEKLVEFVDLDNEENQRDSSKTHNKQSSSQDIQTKMIDLCNEEGNKNSTSLFTEYIDLENISSDGKPVAGKQVEFVDLDNEDNKRNSSKIPNKQSSSQDERQSKVIDLCDEDKNYNTSFTEYVDLENVSSDENPVTGKQVEFIDLDNS